MNDYEKKQVIRLGKRKKRNNGSGGVQPVTRNGYKYYRYQYLVGGKYVYRYAKTEKEAQLNLARSIVMVADGKVTQKELKISDYAEIWLEHLKNTNSIKPKTLRNYELNIKRVLPFIGKKRLSDITPVELERIYIKLKENLSKSSVNQVHRTLKNLYNHAMRSGYVIKNIAALAKAPTIDKRKPVILSRNGWSEVIEVSRTEDKGLIIEFLLRTGMRVDVEALSSKWDDLDFINKTVTVSESKTEAGTNRKIPLDTELFEKLVTKYKLLQLKRKLHKNFNKDNYIFCNETGEREDYANIRKRVWLKIKRKLSVDKRIRMHDLRHNFGSYLLSENVPITMVSKILGHADVSTTLNIYSHELPEDLTLVREALNKISVGSTNG